MGDERKTRLREARNSSAREKGGILLLCAGQMGARCRLTLPVEFQRCVVGKLVVHADLSEQGWEIDDCPMRSDLAARDLEVAVATDFKRFAGRREAAKGS